MSKMKVEILSYQAVNNFLSEESIHDEASGQATDTEKEAT